MLAALNTKKNQKYSLVSAAHSNIIIETIKQAEDKNGIIIRMYESENAYTKTKLTVNTVFKKASLCNLLEQEEEELKVTGNEIAVCLKPYEVVTIKLS